MSCYRHALYFSVEFSQLTKPLWRMLQGAAVNFSSPFPRIRKLPAKRRQQHDESYATILFLLVGITLGFGQQMPRLPPGNPSHRLADIRRRVESKEPVDMSARRALEFSRYYLDRGKKCLQSGRSTEADRIGAAAESLLHIAEHQEHLRTPGGPVGPPPAAEIYNHLQRVYFLTQQADYFFREAHDPSAKSLPKWSRDFYQLAARAYDRNDWLAADENAKCAEEVIRALENLAQAATLAGAPGSLSRP